MPECGWRHHPAAKMWTGYREALVRKDPEFYRPRFGPDVPADLPYEWPSSDRPGR